MAAVSPQRHRFERLLQHFHERWVMPSSTASEPAFNQVVRRSVAIIRT